MNTFNLFGDIETQNPNSLSKTQRRKLDKLRKKKLGDKDYFYSTTGSNIFYTDGFLDGKNSVVETGGFTVFKNGSHLITEHCSSISHKVLTSNEAELLGVCYAIAIAEIGDTIITDSMNTLSWLRSGDSNARPDLNTTLKTAKTILNEKELNIYWESRDSNLAGNYNEFELKE